MVARAYTMAHESIGGPLSQATVKWIACFTGDGRDPDVLRFLVPFNSELHRALSMFCHKLAC